MKQGQQMTNLRLPVARVLCVHLNMGVCNFQRIHLCPKFGCRGAGQLPTFPILIPTQYNNLSVQLIPSPRSLDPSAHSANHKHLSIGHCQWCDLLSSYYVSVPGEYRVSLFEPHGNPWDRYHHTPSYGWQKTLQTAKQHGLGPTVSRELGLVSRRPSQSLPP